MNDRLPTVAESALRGIACRCPRCGKGKLYAGFLNLRPSCEACGLDYAFIDPATGLRSSSSCWRAPSSSPRP